MSSYSEYDLERDLRDARRARARATGRPHRPDGVMAYIRSRSTDRWIMFAAGLVVGAILL